MKKDTLYFIIAVLGLYIAWRSYQMTKKHLGQKASGGSTGSGTGTAGSGSGGSTGGGADNPTGPINPTVNEVPVNPGNPAEPSADNDPHNPTPTPSLEPVITEKVTIENCPYCGTSNATVTRVYQDGHLLKMQVACNNKSCPQSYGSKSKIGQSGKMVSAR